MRIDWIPSKEVQDKARKIFNLHKEGLTFLQIGKVIGHTRVYTNDLHSWYKANIKNNE